MSGCGSSTTSSPNKPVDKPKIEEPRRAVATGAVELEQKDSDLDPQWSVRADSSELTYEEGKAVGSLSGVTGKTFTEGKEDGTFSADIGLANQKNNSLVLKKNIILNAIEEKTKQTLRADNLTWLSDFELVRASGGVTVSQVGSVLGPIPQLLATKDLKFVGTPDQFKDRIQALIQKQKAKSPVNTATIAALTALLTTPAVATQSGSYQAGDLTITGYSSIRAEVLDDDRIQFSISGKGVKAVSKSKGMVLRADRITGFLVQKGQQKQLQSATLTGDILATLDGDDRDFEITCTKIDLKNGSELIATLTGGVRAKQKSESGNINLSSDSATATLVGLGEKAKEPLKSIRITGDVVVTKPGTDDNLTLTTSSATYAPGEPSTITFPNALKAVQTKPGSSVTMTASEGIVKLVPGQNPLQTATLSGAIVLVATRSGKDKAGQSYTDRYEATGQKLVYSDTQRRITLTSRVRVESKSRAMEGTAEGTELIVLLDENRKAKGIEMNGDPGTADIKEIPNKKP